MWVAAAAPELAGPVISVDGVPFFSALRNAGATPDGIRPQAEQIRKFYQTLTAEQIAAQNRMAFASMMTDPSRVEAAMKWGASDGPAAGAMIAEIMTTDIRADVGRIKSPCCSSARERPLPRRPIRRKWRRRHTKHRRRASRRTKLFLRRTRCTSGCYDDLPFLLKTMDAFLTGWLPPAPVKAGQR